MGRLRGRSRVVVALFGALAVALGLLGCGAGAPAVAPSSGARGRAPARTAGARAVPGSEYVAAGARSDAGGDEWIELPGSLQVSRDAGRHWHRLPLPPLARHSVLSAVSVLPRDTVAVVRLSRFDGVEICTWRRGGRRWRRTAVPVPGPPGNAEIVDKKGTLVGVMVQEEAGSNFSIGWWASKGRGATGWQVHDLPVAGAITDAHGLWLVGGVLDSSIYRSRDGGRSWRKVAVPTELDRRNGFHFSRVEVDGGRLVLAAVAQHRIQLIVRRGRAGWHDARVLDVRDAALRLIGGFDSLAAGTVWLGSIVGSIDARIARVDLATGRLSIVNARGVPRGGGSSSLHALGRRSAWVSYEATECLQVKSECTTTRGIDVTDDGGAIWRPATYPLRVGGG